MPNIQNLTILRDYLQSLPVDAPFCMKNYVTTTNLVQAFLAHIPLYGTKCCMVGYAPRAGILPLPKEEWIEYVERVFQLNEKEKQYLFGSHWADDLSTNTLKEGIRRLNVVLKRYNGQL